MRPLGNQAIFVFPCYKRKIHFQLLHLKVSADYGITKLLIFVNKLTSRLEKL